MDTLASGQAGAMVNGPDRVEPSTSRSLDSIYYALARLEAMISRGEHTMQEIAQPISRIDGDGPCFAPRKGEPDAPKVAEGPGSLLHRMENLRHHIVRLGDRAEAHADDLDNAYARLIEAV